MDMMQIEMAAEIVFRMCKEHPEICPHDYHWTGTDDPYEENGKKYRLVHYKCGLCETEHVELKEVK